jgi:hypothetical protein
MPRLLQRAALVGLGGYALAVVLVGWFALRHPEAYVHFTPLEGFGIDAALRIASFIAITMGAAVGLLLVRGRSSRLSAAWLFLSGAAVVLLARAIPRLPALALESCPPGEVCNPYDWSVPLEWLREPLLALAVVVVIGMVANSNAGTPPNKSLERTREG